MYEVTTTWIYIAKTHVFTITVFISGSRLTQRLINGNSLSQSHSRPFSEVWAASGFHGNMLAAAVARGDRRNTEPTHTTNPYHYRQTEIVHLAHTCICTNTTCFSWCGWFSRGPGHAGMRECPSAHHVQKGWVITNVENKYQGCVVINCYLLSQSHYCCQNRE